MLKLIQKYRNTVESHRKNEQGYTLIEMIVVLVLFSIVGTMTLYPVVVATRAVSAFQQSYEGVNQGVTHDAVREAFRVAQEFHTDYPDLPVTNENLSAYGYTADIPTTVQWGVGQDNRLSDSSQNAVCAVAYSLTEDDGKFTEEAPVEINTHFQGQYLKSPGCWGVVYEGIEYNPETESNEKVYGERHVANGLNEAEEKLTRNHISTP